MTPLGGKVPYRQWYKEMGGGGGMESLEALGVDGDVYKNGRHLGCHLGFYQELEIRITLAADSLSVML